MSNKVNVVLDASMLDLFMLCEARFNYRHNLLREPPIKAKPLDRGSVVHSALERYYSLLKDKVPFDTAANEMVTTARSAGNESELEPAVVSRIITVLSENIEFWRNADARFEILIVEQPFSYELHSDDDVRIIMTGKIDLMVNSEGYTNMPVDHKSYDREYPIRRLSNQFLNYCNAVGSNFLLVNKIGFQTTLKPVEKYKRIPVSYDSLIIEEWKDNVVKWVNRYLTCAATGDWSMNFTSCDKYNRACEYLEVCESSGREAKEYKLTANFKTGTPWDVSQSLGVKK